MVKDLGRFPVKTQKIFFWPVKPVSPVCKADMFYRIKCLFL